LRHVDEPKLSADGNLVVYILKTADMQKDKVPGNLWLAKWDGSENRATHTRKQRPVASALESGLQIHRVPFGA
jgi:hypothetical protein